MSSEFFGELERRGLVSVEGPVADKINSEPIHRLIDLAEESAETSTAQHLSQEDSVLSHSASISLGGGRFPCRMPACRIERARQLAYFALLYSDRVYIPNLLANLAQHSSEAEHTDPAGVRKSFEQDLAVLCTFRPLIESGHIVPFTTPSNYCAHCLASRGLGPDGHKRIERLRRRLDRQHSEKLAFSLEWDGDNFVLDISGPELLVDHGRMRFVFGEPPQALQRMPRIRARAVAGDTVVLSKSARSKVAFHKRMTQRVIESLAFELTAAQSLRTAFLTDRELEIQCLSELNIDGGSTDRNALIGRYLTSIVPFVQDVTLNDLMKLRASEGDAFIAYRSALNHAIDAVRDAGQRLDVKTAQALYGDLIEPSLARVNRSVETTRSAHLRKTARSAVGWVGAISFGMYSGFVPTDLIAAASALGMTAIVADLVRRLMESSDIGEPARNDEMYFLWKVRRAAKR